MHKILKNLFVIFAFVAFVLSANNSTTKKEDEEDGGDGDNNTSDNKSDTKSSEKSSSKTENGDAGSMFALCGALITGICMCAMI